MAIYRGNVFAGAGGTVTKDAQACVQQDAKGKDEVSRWEVVVKSPRGEETIRAYATSEEDAKKEALKKADLRATVQSVKRAAD